MDQKMKIILLFAMPYSITSETDNSVTRGITVNYYLGTELKNVSNENGSIGMRPAKCSIPYDRKDKLVSAPALYDAKFEMSIGSDGRPVLKIVDLDYIGNVNVSPVKP